MPSASAGVALTRIRQHERRPGTLAWTTFRAAHWVYRRFVRFLSISTIGAVVALGVPGCSCGGSPSARDAAPDRNLQDSAPPDEPTPSEAGIDSALLSMTPTAACQAMVRAACTRTRTCVGALAAGDCERFANLCPDYYFPPGMDRSIEAAVRCTDGLVARTCTDFPLGFRPAACSYGDALPAGSACSYYNQCASGACVGPSAYCGSCWSSGDVPIGGRCKYTQDCQPGSFCHSVVSVCMDVHTIVYVGPGEPCDLTATPVVGCTGDLLCITPAGQTTGACQPAPGPGQACANWGGFSSVCAAGSICTAAFGGACQLIGACGDGGVCEEGSYCEASDGACHPRAKVGEACAVSDTGGLPQCLPPAICVSSTGRCDVPGSHGDACDTAHPCATLLTCASGACRLPSELFLNCPIDGGANEAGPSGG